jgi:hypothetical protein
MPLNPWDVEPGLYVRVDGQVIYLTGQTYLDYIGNKKESGHESGSSRGSMECCVGSSAEENEVENEKAEVSGNGRAGSD